MSAKEELEQWSKNIADVGSSIGINYVRGVEQMNADIQKYRVWSGAEYMNTETIFLLPSGELGFFVRSMGYPHYRKFNNQSNFTIEHCTGLRDRNGNLIYEGDVVMWHRSTAWGLGGERRGHVFWHDKFGSFGVRSTLGDGFSITEIGECQIIGNVHDNEVKR